jgi:hypothetical protein
MNWSFEKSLLNKQWAYFLAVLTLSLTYLLDPFEASRNDLKPFQSILLMRL